MRASLENVTVVVIVHEDELVMLEAFIFELSLEPICSPCGHERTLFTVFVKVIDGMDLDWTGGVVRAVILDFIFER